MSNGRETRRRYSFVQLDVFTAQPLEGNQLAVFTDGRGLSDSEMQAIAREMNLSETTFILRRAAEVEARAGVEVRIFTVEEELPFAGHPTLGTAAALRELRAEGGRRPELVELALQVGKIPVRFREEPGGPAFGEMRQRDPEFGTVHTREEVARAAGLELEELDPELPIQTVSTGIAFGIVPLRDHQALAGLRFNCAQAQTYLDRADCKFLYFVTRDVSAVRGRLPEARLQARMIFYNGEDPATGSAAGCAAAWMVRHGVAAPEEQMAIAQGFEMRRPSHIFVRAGRAGDTVTDVRVGGHTVEVLRGELAL